MKFVHTMIRVKDLDESMKFYKELLEMNQTGEVELDKMSDFTEKMNKLGYKYLYEPFFMPQVNMYIAFLNDPDGNEIEIMAKQA